MKRIALFICFVVLSSCMLQSIEVDEDINLELRTEINNLNRQVVRAIELNNTEMLQAMCSEDFATSPKCREIVANLNGHASMSVYGRGHEFHVITLATNKSQKLSTKYDREHNFSLDMVMADRENYISTIEIGNWTSTIAIFTTYIKHRGKWLINDMEVGLVRLATKDAVGWYEKAKDAYNKGALIDAAMMMDLCNKVVKPVPFFQYLQEPKLKKFYKTVIGETEKKYTFPFPVFGFNDLEIFNVRLHLVESGMYPLVFYKSNIDLSDSIGISIECDKLHSQIGKIFKGIDTYNDTIFYRIGNEIPVNGKPYDHYIFSRATKNKL